jgi:NitT/TauT family transport system substrate-binding protein
VVVAYIEALIDANAWVRSDPRLAASRIQEWTHIEKEVAYMFLGPSGIHTLDPTIKPQWVSALKDDYGVLQRLKMIKPLDISSWVDDRYVRKAFSELGLDYDKQLSSLAGYAIAGYDAVCGTTVTDSAIAGQIWVQDGPIDSFSSSSCTLAGVKRYGRAGKKLAAVYVMDRALGIKLFADTAFYVVDDKRARPADVVPFLLKRDAERYAKETGGKVGTYADALSAVSEEATLAATALGDRK